MLRHFVPFFLFFLSSFQLSATHIIGGSLTYEYLGNDNYLVKLEVLRDCYNGSPNAWFDDPASIGIFNTDNTLVNELLIPLDPTINDTITLSPENIVCIYDPSICIHRTFYEEVVNLPFVEGGYQLAYQRCCRSQSITNLMLPLESGMTFHTSINTEVENNSPQWDKDVPFGIYVGVPFVYDGSASDIDGDSIVYSLVAPTNGVDQDTPMPQPPSSPPFGFSIFSEGFSTENMLGGDYPLTIDSLTGEMTAIPAFSGLFQIAYQAEEYREGILISTIRREFTFAVTPANPDLTFDFSGTVVAETADGVQPLDFGTVELLQRNISTNLLSSVETVDVVENGDYIISEVPAGVFYFKAAPAPNSIFYGEYLPTYYRDDLFWYETDALNQCDTSQLYRDITLIKAEMLTGSGSILTGYIQDDAGLAVSNLALLIRNENTGNFVQYLQTGLDGSFSITDLSDSDVYGVYVDLINSNIFNVEVPTFSLQTNSTATGILYDDRLEFDLGTATTNPRDNDFDILPNPSSGVFTLQMPDNFRMQDSKVIIRDVSGKVVLRENLIDINQQFLLSAKGVFFVSVVSENESFFSKLVVE